MRIGRLAWAFCVLLWLETIGTGAPTARELRLSHQLPESDARHRAARVLAAELKRRAPDLAITIHPNSSLIADPPQQYEAIIDGRIEMAVYPMAYASAKFPELSIVTMPGIPANAEAASLLKGSEFEVKLQELCEEKGFRVLTWWWLDGGMVSRTRAITGPQSVKGLTARSGSSVAAAQAGRAGLVLRSRAETGRVPGVPGSPATRNRRARREDGRAGSETRRNRS